MVARLWTIRSMPELGFQWSVNHVLPAWDFTCGIYVTLAVLAAFGTEILPGRASRSASHWRTWRW